MINLRRKSSPRTKKKYDRICVKTKDVKRYLRAGWEKYSEEESEPEPEPAPRLIAYKDLTLEQKKAILNSGLSQQKTADKFNVSYYTVRKIQGTL